LITISDFRSVFRLVKRYKKKLEKQFIKQNGRDQWNFACDKRISIAIKMLAKELEIPIYPLCEHILQLGMSEVVIATENENLKEELCRHLVQSHLLVPETELEPPSEGALRARSVISFLHTVENWAGSPEALAEVVKRMIKEAALVGETQDSI
jgi:hypothetical protein